MKAALILVTVALAGCTTAHEMVGPSGAAGYAVTCNGTASGWDRCYTKAHEMCGGAYNVLSTGGDSHFTRSLEVECKRS